MTRPRSPLRAFGARRANPSIMLALGLLAGLVPGGIGGTECCAADDVATTTILPQGELQLDLTLHRGPLVATWRGLLSMAIVSTGDTWDQKEIEGLRELFDVYLYLAHQGVVEHTIRITLAGRQNARAQGQKIYMNGIRAEAD